MVNMSLLIANAILILHALFISVVVFAVPLILIGGWRNWQWVRSKRFRFTHLAMIGFVALESLIGMDCPLTIWENNLRRPSGGRQYTSEGFIAHWLHSILFYDFPHWVFMAIYMVYAILVASLFYFVPLQRNGKLKN